MLIKAVKFWTKFFMKSVSTAIKLFSVFPLKINFKDRCKSQLNKILSQVFHPEQRFSLAVSSQITTKKKKYLSESVCFSRNHQTGHGFFSNLTVIRMISCNILTGLIYMLLLFPFLFFRTSLLLVRPL